MNREPLVYVSAVFITIFRDHQGQVQFVGMKPTCVCQWHGRLNSIKTVNWFNKPLITLSHLMILLILKFGKLFNLLILFEWQWV
jgi:hypothetical protein